MQPRTLVVFGGLPGTGKTTIAQALARRFCAVYLRIDLIEEAIRAAGIKQVGVAGYTVANALAETHLNLGHAVIADCVDPVLESRNAWKATAGRTSSGLFEIEIICSNPVEHRQRVEGRVADMPGQALPTWSEVVTKKFEPWAGRHLVLDSAIMTPPDLIRAAEEYVLVQANSR